MQKGPSPRIDKSLKVGTVLSDVLHKQSYIIFVYPLTFPAYPVLNACTKRGQTVGLKDNVPAAIDLIIYSHF